MSPLRSVRTFAVLAFVLAGGGLASAAPFWESSEVFCRALRKLGRGHLLRAPPVRLEVLEETLQRLRPSGRVPTIEEHRQAALAVVAYLQGRGIHCTMERAGDGRSYHVFVDGDEAALKPASENSLLERLLLAMRLKKHPGVRLGFDTGLHGFLGNRNFSAWYFPKGDTKDVFLTVDDLRGEALSTLALHELAHLEEDVGAKHHLPQVTFVAKNPRIGSHIGSYAHELVTEEVRRAYPYSIQVDSQRAARTKRQYESEPDPEKKRDLRRQSESYAMSATTMLGNQMVLSEAVTQMYQVVLAKGTDIQIEPGRGTFEALDRVARFADGTEAWLSSQQARRKNYLQMPISELRKLDPTSVYYEPMP